MRNRFPGLALIVFLGLGILIVIPTGAAEPVDAKKIEKLIDRLGGDDFGDREKATVELDAIGVPALEALKKARASKDVEISKRAADLVAKIEKRGVAASLLAPKKLRLIYKETPVTEAVADFAKKSGYPIQILDPEGKLKDRKISLDTGEVTFWQAFELFCDQAGLKEMDPLQGLGGFGGFGGIGVGPGPLPIPKAPPAKEEKQPQKDEPQPGVKRGAVPGAAFAQFQAAPAQAPAAPPPAIGVLGGPVPGAIGFGGGAGVIGFGFNGGMPGQIILLDGKAKAMPVDTTSAIRVKVMEKAEFFGPAKEKEILLGLKVSAEPKLQILQLVNVRIAKAVDDQGQNLTQAADPVPEAPALPKGAPGLPAIGRMPNFFFGGMDQMTPVRLKKGEKAAKSLKELTGVIAAEVLTPPAAVITADRIMFAAGKEFKGTEGGKLKILQVVKAANGQITVKFELEAPANVFPANGFNPFGIPGGIQIMPNPAPPRSARPARTRRWLSVPGPSQARWDRRRCGWSRRPRFYAVPDRYRRDDGGRERQYHPGHRHERELPPGCYAWPRRRAHHGVPAGEGPETGEACLLRQQERCHRHPVHAEERDAAVSIADRAHRHPHPVYVSHERHGSNGAPEG